MLKKQLLLGVFLLVSGSTGLAAAGTGRDSIFLVSPMAGTIKSDIQYTMPGGGGKKAINDNGPLYAVHMMYADPRLSIGCMGHYSQLAKSYESGTLIFAHYYAGTMGELQPAFGFDLDYIHVYTQLPQADITPLASLDVDTNIWALHPTVGVSYATSNMRITPFAGYFNEQVNTVVMSEGMRIGGTNRNGFKSTPSAVLDYVSVGSKFEYTFHHFVNLSLKFYYRMRQGDRSLFTTRNRIDFYLSKNMGIAVKLDYFDDNYEKNTFFLAGPVFVF